MNFYQLPITELKKKYTDLIINLAFRSWKEKKLDIDTICGKSEGLIERLDRASKAQFIAILNNYQKGE